MFTPESGKPLALFSLVILLALGSLAAGQFIATPTQTAAASPYPAQFVGFDEPNPGLVPPIVMPSVFGPRRSYSLGDAFSATNSPNWSEQYGVYTFQIDIPQSYPYDKIRVELFDPDTYNPKTGTGDGEHNAKPVYRIDGTYTTKSCPDPTDRPWNGCQLTTRVPGSNEPETNDIGFVRTDEIRWTSTGSPTCTYDPVRCPNSLWYDTWGTYDPANTNYATKYLVPTMFRLYYLRQSPDGTLNEVDLAYYVSSTDAHTDLMWVSPGAPAEERADEGLHEGGGAVPRAAVAP